MAEDDGWIFASVINFLQSPLWSTPVLHYVDNNCIYFDKEEENKLEYTSIHEGYQKLVEDLIEQYVLKELNLTEEQFVNACQKEVGNAYAKILFDQVIAADDFLIFKKVMFRRNVTLENEVLAAIQAKEQEEREKEARARHEAEAKNKNKPIEQLERELGDADENMEIAIRLSQVSYESERKKRETSAKDDDEVKKALEHSKKEQDEYSEVMKKEKADLDAAIALSLAAVKDQKYSQMKAEERARVATMHEKLLQKQDTNDKKQQEILLELQKQRLLDEDRQTAANSALDKLFARRKALNQREESLTADMDDEERLTRKKHIKEERTKLLEQSNKERETALKEYLDK